MSSFHHDGLFDVSRKVVLVTGGSRGIGKAVRRERVDTAHWVLSRNANADRRCIRCQRRKSQHWNIYIWFYAIKLLYNF